MHSDAYVEPCHTYVMKIFMETDTVIINLCIYHRNIRSTQIFVLRLCVELQLYFLNWEM